MTLQSRNVLITGAYGGLGSALSRAYLEKGYNVALLGRDGKKLDRLMESLSVEK